MPSFKLSLTFFDEPFRLIEWVDKAKRNPANVQWIRGQGFARWHKITSETGIPFVTGTSIRSKVIREVEALLSRSSGTWGGVRCCAGSFDTKGQLPVHLRYRPTLEWESGNKIDCTSEEDACPLCLLLGRFDGAGKKNENQVYKQSDYHVYWQNLTTNLSPCRLEDIARKRVLNRVDFFSKKAHDHYTVWEVTGVKTFSGYLHISDAIQENLQVAVISLLKTALAFTDTLCGALCKFELSEKLADTSDVNHSANKNGVPSQNFQFQKNTSAPDIIEKIESLATTFSQALMGNLRQIRILADAVREMRTLQPELFKLPKGRLGEDGNESDHFLWDTPVGDKSIRKILEETICSSKNSTGNHVVHDNWLFFCNELGQKLYEHAKAGTPMLKPKRPLGEVSFSNVSSHAPKHDMICRVKGGFIYEWIIIGDLRALTPFHIGTENQAGKQISIPVLLDSEGRQFRLPRTALRGALRRDINLTSGGQGCVVKLGADNLCPCPACQILRQVRLRDTTSSLALPSAVRQKICKNPILGVVNEGSLYDVELGIEGEMFPFVMRYRGGKELPRFVTNVLAWWQNGCLFIGGESGTGRGRFSLENLRIFSWNIVEGQQDYIHQHGFRNSESRLLTERSDISGLEENKDLLAINRKFILEKICWEICFTGPVLTGDPLTALLKGNTDSIFYQKPVITEEAGNASVSYIYAIKSDSVRGWVRSALGRKNGSLLTSLHEDCDCLLCEAFGNKHHEGKLRFEDLIPTSSKVESQRMDHVAIDRITGGSVDKCKYDDEPLVGTSVRPLVFRGIFWIDQNSSEEMKNALAAALHDIRDGLCPIGANSGTGYGWINNLTITDGPDWLKNCLQKQTEIHMQEKEPVQESTADSLTKIISPELPILNFDSKAIYYPHYFLPIGKHAGREHHPVSHDRYEENLLTGRIVCTLTTQTPLIVPDTRNNQTMEKPDGAPDSHKAFQFYRIHDEIMIPGSELRGMISSVFEALTGSCFRVMNQKSHLSWRVMADEATKEKEGFRPGRVEKDTKELSKINLNNLSQLQAFRGSNR